MNQSEYVLRQPWICYFDLVIETDLFLLACPGVNLFQINAPAPQNWLTKWLGSFTIVEEKTANGAAVHYSYFIDCRQLMLNERILEIQTKKRAKQVRDIIFSGALLCKIKKKR